MPSILTRSEHEDFINRRKERSKKVREVRRKNTVRQLNDSKGGERRKLIQKAARGLVHIEKENCIKACVIV